jgi:acyl-CoA thioesterase I
MRSLISVDIMQRLSLAIVLFLAAAVPVPGLAGPVCDMPAELITPPGKLRRVAAAMATKQGLEILALGSGSTVGDSGASGGPALTFHAPETAYPFRMVAALQAMRPADHFQITVKGGRNMTAETMLTILREQLAAHHYDLVLWQTGTVEAVHGSRTDSLQAVLQEGTDAAAHARSDLILIDPQFSRFLRANADLNPYQTVLQQMAGNPDVTLFHRFELTQGWVNSGQVDLERASRDDRDKTIALLNTCLGEALAHYILAGITEH